MSREFEVQPDDVYREAMRSLIATRWKTLWKAIPAAIADENPEGVHQVRIASRRLRAAMDVSADCFPTRWYKPLHASAKDITSALGAVRDRDVQLEDFGKLRKRATPTQRTAIDHLADAISDERAEAVESMISYLKKLESSDLRKESKRRFPTDRKGKRGKSNGGRR